jgi:hypothetical protein
MNPGRGAMQSDYMHWFKVQAPMRFDLSASDSQHFRLDRLPLDIDQLDLDGASHPRYAPLRQAIARRYGVSAENVVTANGTSMANFLAMATLIAPGDEIIVEQPGYEPMLSAARFLGADIERIQRVPDDGFWIDLRHLEKLVSSKTRLIAITNLHNPSGALTEEADLRAIGRREGSGRRGLPRQRRAASTDVGAARPSIRRHQQPDQSLWPQRPALRLDIGRGQPRRADVAAQ